MEFVFRLYHLFLILALTNCGGDLTAALGEIQSPLVPLSYVGDVVCRWKISVKEGHGVMLSFNLPWKYNKGCQTFISVKEISQYEEEVQEMKICSKSDIPEEITMETNAVVLEYHAKVSLKLQLHYAIYRLRFYSNSLIHSLSLSNSHSNVASVQKNRGDKSHRVIVALNSGYTIRFIGYDSIQAR